MIGTQLLRELIETIILTGRVEDIAPVSLLLIAAPESGKTSIVLEKDCKTVKAFSDVTGKGLQLILAMNRDITHLVINDMVAMMSHRSSVNRYTVAMLNAITEEGLFPTADPSGIHDFDCGRKGVIASLTMDLTQDGRNWWNKVGFTSRMLPFCYFYEQDLVLKIKESINANGGHAKKKKSEPDQFIVPKEPIPTIYPEELIARTAEIAGIRSRIMKETGLRRLKQYHAIVRAHAVLRDPTPGVKVIQADIDFLRSADLYVSYDMAYPL
jgi:hypothetical protein